MKHIKKFEELDAKTIKSASDKMVSKNQYSRGDKLIANQLREFNGKELMGGTILSINPSYYTSGDTGYIIKIGTEPVTRIVYRYDLDAWLDDSGKGLNIVPTRADAVLLSKIAKKINPETRTIPQSFDIESYR